MTDDAHLLRLAPGLRNPRPADGALPEEDEGIASCVACRGAEWSLSAAPCGSGCCSVPCPWCHGDGVLFGDAAGGVADACGQVGPPLPDALREYSDGAFWLRRFGPPPAVPTPVPDPGGWPW